MLAWFLVHCSKQIFKACLSTYIVEILVVRLIRKIPVMNNGQKKMLPRKAVRYFHFFHFDGKRLALNR